MNANKEAKPIPEKMQQLDEQAQGWHDKNHQDNEKYFEDCLASCWCCCWVCDVDNPHHDAAMVELQATVAQR